MEARDTTTAVVLARSLTLGLRERKKIKGIDRIGLKRLGLRFLTSYKTEDRLPASDNSILFNILLQLKVCDVHNGHHIPSLNSSNTEFKEGM